MSRWCVRRQIVHCCCEMVTMGHKYVVTDAVATLYVVVAAIGAATNKHGRAGLDVGTAVPP